MNRPAEPPPDRPGIQVPPPTVYLLVFLAGLLLQRYAALPRVTAPALRIGGFALMFAGLVVAVWSFALFWIARTSPAYFHPTRRIVTGGPYRVSRNPMYLALLALYVGLSLWLGLLGPLLLTPMVVLAMNAFIISREESYLDRRFGEEYREYRSRVRRWL